MINNSSVGLNDLMSVIFPFSQILIFYEMKWVEWKCKEEVLFHSSWATKSGTAALDMSILHMRRSSNYTNKVFCDHVTFSGPRPFIKSLCHHEICFWHLWQWLYCQQLSSLSMVSIPCDLAGMSHPVLEWNRFFGNRFGSMNSEWPPEWSVTRNLCEKILGKQIAWWCILYRGVRPTSSYCHRWLCWYNYSIFVYTRWSYPVLKHHHLVVIQNSLNHSYICNSHLKWEGRRSVQVVGGS